MTPPDRPAQPAPDLDALWTYCPECGSDRIRYAEGEHKQCGACGQEWFATIDYSEVVQKNLTTLRAQLTEAQDDLKNSYPVHNDGTHVFVDGHGDVFLDYDDARLKRAEAAEARVAELEAETKLNGEFVDSAQEHARNAHVKYLAEKARADGLAAAIDGAVEELDAIEKAASALDPWDELQVRAADTAKKLRMAAALTEGGA